MVKRLNWDFDGTHRSRSLDFVFNRPVIIVRTKTKSIPYQYLDQNVLFVLGTFLQLPFYIDEEAIASNRFRGISVRSQLTSMPRWLLHRLPRQKCP